MERDARRGTRRDESDVTRLGIARRLNSHARASRSFVQRRLAVYANRRAFERHCWSALRTVVGQTPASAAMWPIVSVQPRAFLP
jgi:hypothetical protein